MAIKTYGDVHIEANDDAINSPAVKHFIMTVYPSYQARRNPLSGIIREIPIMGESASFPRDHGAANFRKVNRHGDRSPVFESVRQTRVDLSYDAYDLDYAIKEDTEVEAMLDQSEMIRDKIMSAAARLEFQIVYDTLVALKDVDSSTKAADGILGIVAANVQWDPVNKVMKENGDPVGWNLQKMAYITTMRRMGNIDVNLVFVARADTVHGLFEDEQAVNSDYMPLKTATSGVGLTSTLDGLGNYWAIVGQFPPADDGTPQGVKAEQSNSDYIATEFAFDPNCLVMTISPRTPKFYLNIYRQPDAKEMRFRASMYLGCGCINPKGVIKIKNKLSMQ